jgi:hypothetical protein
MFPQFTLEDLRYPPPYDDDIAEWTSKNLPGMYYHSRDLCTNYRMDDETGKWSYDYPTDSLVPPVAGFWMAAIPSPGLKLPPEDPYYPMPALHAVVFKGSRLYHDPNPKYKGHWVNKFPVVLRLNWWSDKPGFTSENYVD